MVTGRLERARFQNTTKMGVSFSFLLPYSSAWTKGGALSTEIGSSTEVGIGCRNMKYQRNLVFLASGNGKEIPNAQWVYKNPSLLPSFFSSFSCATEKRGAENLPHFMKSSFLIPKPDKTIK